MLPLYLKLKDIALLSTLIFAITWAGCKGGSTDGKKELINFKAYNGINYSEVARRQKNGLSFNEYGYQLEPQWKMQFVSDDSVSIYSPTKKKFINFPLTRGYDSVFNAARSWLKVKTITKDSLVLEIIKATGDSLDIKGTKVYMLFYADNYVKKVLHTDTSILRHPSRKDTMYIRSLAARSHRDYKNEFAARQPVTLTSKTTQLKVTRRLSNADILNNFDNSDDYLDPTYDIIIYKAYKDFYYSFTVYVDDVGQAHYGKPLIDFGMAPDSEEGYVKGSTGIMNSYLNFYLNIIPGSTLGIAHSSMISVHVEGKTTPAK